MALVNPSIAMSYKPTTEYQPRNVLAEYAQLQQIQGGQRQSEMADMQMQEYRQNKEALGRIQAAIVAKGGPPDLRAAANEMIKNPQYMDKGIQILETLKNQEAMDAYFNLPAAQPTNALAPAPLTSGALGSGTFDPMSPAAPVNAMVSAAPTAPVAAPVNQLGADRTSIETKIAQLGRINDPRAVAEVKRLERQLTAMEPTPDIKTMTALGYPITQEGFEAYRAAQRQEQLTFEQRKELAREGRSTTPRAEPAPTIAQIEDPNNPGRMITIDARRYVPGTNVGVIGSSGKDGKDKDATVSEQQAAYNLGRVLAAAGEVAKIAKEDPGALQPGVMEALPSSVGMSGTANLARNANRQIVDGAQRDALDALLVLATGAAYNKEQLEGQTRAYIPSFTDKAETIKAKQQRMANLIQSAKVRAGKAWTPEMETASQVLINPTAAPKILAKPTAKSITVPPLSSGAPLAPNIDALVKKYENK